MDDTVSRELSPSEKRVFGENAKLGPDGKPIERGIGAPPANVVHSAHAASLRVAQLADGLIESAKTLAAHAAEIAKAAKDSVQSSHKIVANRYTGEPIEEPAVEEPAPPPPAPVPPPRRVPLGSPE